VDSPQNDSVAGDQLKGLVERIEYLALLIDGWKADIKEIYAEAKAGGFDTAAIRAIVALRKKDAAERQEAEAILELYKAALGMQ
jgi:uncharacterized protein (UPF0335 family)